MLLLPTLVLLTTVTSVVSSLGAPLVPAIAVEAGVSFSDAQWTLTAALLSGAVATPVAGRLGGNRRRRAVIIGGLVVVAVGTLLAALPLGFSFLLAGRAMQGVGMALTPLAFAVAREFVEDSQPAIALLSVTTIVGAGLGYPVTAVVAEHFGIHAAFWLGLAICLVTLSLAVTSVPRSTSTAVDRVDWLGAGLLASGTASFLVAISQGDPWGWTSGRVLALVLFAVVTLVLWVRRTLRVEHPLVDLRLARSGGAVAANLTALTGGIATYLLLSIVMIQVQAPTTDGFGLGRSVTVAGLLLVPYSLLSFTGSRVTTSLSRWITPDFILPIGAAVFASAIAGLAVWHTEVWQVAVVMAVAGVGSGCTFAALPGLIVRSVPAEETGSATAFNHVMRMLGFSTGSALALALLEVFSVGGAMTDSSYAAVAWVGSAIWAGTGAVTLGLALRRIS
ncbi:MAG TPA: MFS transporter [Marmoricola sp.]|nr:MFS transporter [Marmoricola sp.]